MGKICRNRCGDFVLFKDSATPHHCKREIYTVTKGSYNNYYNDYEEIRHYTGKYEDLGFWEYLDDGVHINIENVPEKYLDMTYDSEPRTI